MRGTADHDGVYDRGGESGPRELGGSSYINGEHWWEKRREVGHAVRLYWYTGILVARPRWRLEGSETSYYLQDPVLVRSEIATTAHWERISGTDPSTRAIEITITCYNTAFPSEEPSLDPTESPSVKPTEEPTEKPTQNPSEEPTEVPTEEPTEEPSETPTEQPTEEPAEPSEEPFG